MKFWFKAKKYGYGWYPFSWQGFLVTISFLLLVFSCFYIIDKNSHSVSDTLINFIPLAIILIIVLFLIAYLKGEELRWRWGT